MHRVTRARNGGVGGLALAAAFMALGPGGASAQIADLSLPRIEVRGALVRNGSGGCGTEASSGFALGVEARTRGRFIVGAAGDVFVTPGKACPGIPQFGTFEGAPAQVEDLHSVGPRLGAQVGYAFALLGAQTELTIGLGLAGTWYSAREGDVFAWRPWQGATGTVRLDSGLGLQAEIGRHRLVDRYYVPDGFSNGGAYLGELSRWEPMLRLGITVPALH